MNEPVSVYKAIQDFARPFVEPLFLQDFFFRTGRSASTTTATATFVHRKGQVYCVTCEHVVREAKSPTANPGRSAGVLALATDAGAIVLGSPDKSCFASPTPEILQQRVDIALAPIPWGIWDTFKHERGLSYINLDELDLPDYTQIRSCAGVGFPNRRKRERDGRIKVDLTVACAELTTPIGTNAEVFQLHSVLDRPHGVGFSGMSGGLVLGILNTQEFAPIGIIFQGGPSGEQDCGGAIAGPCDVFLRCRLLTPTIFDGWVARTDFPDVRPEYMVVVPDEDTDRV